MERNDKRKGPESMTFRIQSWMKWSFAAILAGTLLVGSFYKSYKNSLEPQIVQPSDIKAPTFSGAFIKLNNGRIVMVDSIKFHSYLKLNGLDVKNKIKPDRLFFGQIRRSQV